MNPRGIDVKFNAAGLKLGPGRGSRDEAEGLKAAVRSPLQEGGMLKDRE